MPKVCNCIPFHEPSDIDEFGIAPKKPKVGTKLKHKRTGKIHRIVKVQDPYFYIEIRPGRTHKTHINVIKAYYEIIYDREFKGIVVDEQKARQYTCERVKSINLVHVKGVVGALSREQIDKLCPEMVNVARPKYEERIDEFKWAVSVCKERTKDMTGAKRVESYIKCMATEAKGAKP